MNARFARLKMTEIGKFRDVLSYDPATGVLTWRYTRGRIFGGTVAGNVRKDTGYREIKVFNKCYKAHRVAWFLVHGWWPGEIDHINGVRADNRLVNLRAVTKQQNNQNRCVQKTNKLGIKGVSKVVLPTRTFFRAYIRWNGRNAHLGCFKTAEEAREARIAAEIKVHGQFRRVAA